MDLKEFYLHYVSETEYHYQFIEFIRDVNRIYNVFDGYKEVGYYKFDVFDAEEAILKFRELCQPKIAFDKEKMLVLSNIVLSV